ncbi:MAG TPA: hypothetical protein VJC39_00970 [Candidatus Nanoarchaeia archaeon]|nr:hypothetical protein [Candidatus Nanoarchaeia archaeon]
MITDKNYSLKSKRGAIELSASMLVVIIISLVLFLGGVALLYQLISKSQDFKNELDQQTAEELQRLLLDQGQQVALYPNSAVLNPGQQQIFGVGVLNIGAEKSFSAQICLSKFADKLKIDRTSEVIGSENCGLKDWILYDFSSFFLDTHETWKVPLLIEVPPTAEPGEYIFNVVICTTSCSHADQYGNTQKVRITVR